MRPAALFLTLVLVLLCFVGFSEAQVITTVAGGGPNNVDALSAPLYYPVASVSDSAGNLYIAIALQDRVYQVRNGKLTVFAGSGAFGGNPGDGGQATAAQLNGPYGLAWDDATNSLYIAENLGARIRQVDSNGVIHTVAGNGLWGSAAECGMEGVATSVPVCGPTAIAIGLDGWIYVADNYRARKFQVGGNLVNIAGNGDQGFSGDGNALQVSLNNPYGIAVDALGNVFIADTYNHRVREVSNGIIRTVAGTGAAAYAGDGQPADSASLNYPFGVAVDAAGTVLVADTHNNRVRAFPVRGQAIGPIGTVAGDGACWYNGGSQPATQAELCGPYRVTTEVGGTVLITDSSNYRIRRFVPGGDLWDVAGNGSLSYGGDNGPVLDAVLSNNATSRVTAAANGDLLLADSSNHVIRKVHAGTITTIAGVGSYGFWGDGEPAANAGLAFPRDVVFDSSQNLLVADTYNNVIRKIDNAGNISTIAGLRSYEGGYADGPALSALMHHPSKIALDPAGNIFFADTDNCLIRKIDMSTPAHNVTTVAGVASETANCNGSANYSGDGLPTSSRLSVPQSLAFDKLGNLYIADTGNDRIRKLDASTHMLSTIAGGGTSQSDGVAATTAGLSQPTDIVVDNTGTLFFSHMMSVHKVTTDGKIYRVAGQWNIGAFAGDGGPATAAYLNGPTGVAGAPGNNLLIYDTSNARVRSVSGVFNYAPPPGPQVGFNPRSLDFSYRIVGSGASLNLAIINTGTAPLSIMNVALAKGAVFHVLSTNCSVAPLLPGQQCLITLVFLAQAYGPVSDVLLVFDNVGGSPQIVPVSGNGVAALGAYLSVTPTVLDFGTQALGSDNTREISLTNWGSSTVTVSQLQLAAATNDFALNYGNCGAVPFSLVPGASCTAKVIFEPILPSSTLKSASVTILSNGGNYTLNASGTATMPPGVAAIVPVGSYPRRIAVDAELHKSYVVDSDGSTVTVIDGVPPFATTAVTVGDRPYAVAIDRATHKAYIASNRATFVTVIDPASGYATKSIETGKYAMDIAVNSQTHRVYVANNPNDVNTDDGTITIIDGQADALLTTVSGSVWNQMSIIVDETHNKAFVGGQSNWMAVIDGDNNVTNYSGASSPWAMAIDEETNLLYASAWVGVSNRATIVDWNTGTAYPVTVGASPFYLAIDRRTHKAYIANNGPNSNTVSVISGPPQDPSVNNVTVGLMPLHVAINSAVTPSLIYVTNSHANSVSVIDGDSDTVSATLPAGSGPWDVGVDPYVGRVYATMYRKAMGLAGAGSVWIYAVPVAPPPNVTPQITQQPVDETAYDGQRAVASFQAKATGTPTPSAQWQRSTDSGTTWTDTQTQTSVNNGELIASTQIYPVSSSMDGQLFRVKFTNSAGSITSRTANLNVLQGSVPVVTQQLIDLYASAGQESPAVFKAQANAVPVATANWEYSTDQGATWISVQDAATTKNGNTTDTQLARIVTTAMDGHLYRVRFTNVMGTVMSGPAKLILSSAPVLKLSLQTAHATVGEPPPAFFTATAGASPTPAVKWEKSSDGGGTYSEVAPLWTKTDASTGYTTTQLAVSDATADMNGYRYRVTFTNNLGTVSSEAALSLSFAPVIVQQPTDQTGYDGQHGGAIPFSAQAKGSPLPSAKFQLSTDGGATWADLATVTQPFNGGMSAVTSVYPISSSMDGWLYRAVFTNELGSVVSQAAKLIVLQGSAPTIVQWAASGDYAAGQQSPLVFTAAAASVPDANVTWERSIDGGFTFQFIPATSTGKNNGITSTQLALSGLTEQMDGYQYRVRFTNVMGEITAGPVTLKLVTPPVITGDLQKWRAREGDNVSLSAYARTTVLADVRFQMSQDNGDTWTEHLATVTFSNGTTFARLDIPNVPRRLDQAMFRVWFTNVAGTAVTSWVRLTVEYPPSVNTQPQDQAVIAGQTATFTSFANGQPHPSVKWQVSTDGGITFTDMVGEWSPLLNVVTEDKMHGYRYRAVFWNFVGDPAISTAAFLTVNTTPLITQMSLAPTVYVGDQFTLSASATGRPTPMPYWQVSTDGGATFNMFPGCTQPTLTLTASSLAMDGYLYRVNFTSVAGTSTSSAIRLTVLRRTPTISIGAGPFTYDGLPHPATVAVTGAGGVAVAGTTTVTYDGNPNAPSAAKATPYNVMVRFTSSDPAYTDASASQALSIMPATLIVTADDKTVVYGSPLPVLTASYRGFVNGEGVSVLTGAPALSTTAASNSHAGEYAITIGRGTLNGANYSLVFVAGTLKITPARQTIDFPDIADKTYGVAPFALGATATSGLPVTYRVDSGRASLATGSTLGIYGTGRVYVTAMQPGNPDYSAAEEVTHSFWVSPALLTIRAQDRTMPYGGPLPFFQASYAGFVNNDSPSDLGGTPQLYTNAFPSSDAGQYPIIATLGSITSTNYTYHFVDGTLTIVGGAAQTVSFPALPNVYYGAGSIVLQAQASSGLPVTYTVAGPATLVAPNTIRIDGAGAVGVTAQQGGNINYAAAPPVTRGFTVLPATLNVIADNKSMYTSGAVPLLTASYKGFVNGDTIAVLSGAPALSTTATSSSPAGTYPIAASLGTLSAKNYVFNLVNGTMSVLVAPAVKLVVTAKVTKTITGYSAVVTIANNGTTTASNVQIKTGTLGGVAASSLPLSAGDIAPGTSASGTVNFAGVAGSSGTAVMEKYAGTYGASSTFSASLVAVLP